MSEIITAGTLIPSTVNTPLDKRSRIAALSDVANIENPALGGIFYCTDTGKHYCITGLKSKQIGPATVENAAVDTYKELTSSTIFPTLILTKPKHGSHLILKKAGSDGTRANAQTIIDTLNTESSRSKVKAYLDSGTDGSWTVCPAGGFASAYDDSPVAVDLSFLTDLPVILYYAWYSDEDSAQMSDWQSMIFPASGGEVSSGTDDRETTGGNISIVVVSELPAAPDSNTLYLIPEG